MTWRLYGGLLTTEPQVSSARSATIVPEAQFLRVVRLFGHFCGVIFNKNWKMYEILTSPK